MYDNIDAYIMYTNICLMDELNDTTTILVGIIIRKKIASISRHRALKQRTIPRKLKRMLLSESSKSLAKRSEKQGMSVRIKLEIR